VHSSFLLRLYHTHTACAAPASLNTIWAKVFRNFTFTTHCAVDPYLSITTNTYSTLYQNTAISPIQSPALSRTNPQASDEVYEAYEPFTKTSRRQQRQQSSRIPSRPSSSSGSTHTLRRTPKFEEQTQPRRRAASVATPERRIPDFVAGDPTFRLPLPASDNDDGSTTPGPRRTSPEPSYWPRRSAQISRRTANAILFALEEAIRTPFPFTPDLVEENASMSDLGGGRAVPGSGNIRAQNGGSRTAAGPVPVPQAPAARVATPRDIVARRLARNEARQREQEEEEQARIEEERRRSAERLTAAAGVAPVKRDSGGGRRSGADQAPQETSERRRSDRPAGDTSIRINPTVISQAAQPAPAPTRVREPTTIPRAPAESSRMRATSQPQQRPVQATTTRAASATYTTNQQQPSQTRLTSVGAGTTQAQAGPSAAPSFQRTQNQQSSATQSRNLNASSFPHAFERWETLSSHWEGLTGYWIRRLEANTEELNGQPINQQLARQVTDLSAAGANLFHAVVELQRLRASSERKFQRWFYESQSEKERTGERLAQLERELEAERKARSEATLGGARIDAERVAAERAAAEEMKRNAEQMVKEMKRELQISRDEARRGWEEIGRMEQAERDRTTSLRNGEPTLVGGVQVVPMQQGTSSRQEGSIRPSTRDGPLPGDTGGIGGASTHAAQDTTESPGEAGYTNYDPARSETDTDPFTEGGRENVAPAVPRVPTSTTPSYNQSSSTSAAAAMQAARSAATTSHPVSPQRSAPLPTSAPAATAGGTYLSYGPGGAILPTPTSGGFYHHQGTGTALLHEDLADQQIRTTEADERSYVQSVDTLSEEDYELDAQGYPRRDAEGQPRLSRQRSGSDDSDEYNVDEQRARERAYGMRYGSAVSGVEYGTGSTATAGLGRAGPSGTSNGQGPVDYSGSGYGWESVPRHHHPTRLSDVLEEDERSRTSPSRASERSRGLH